MSAFGFYEKDEVVDAIKLLAEAEAAKGKTVRAVVESVMVAVTYGLDHALYNIENKGVEQ